MKKFSKCKIEFDRLYANSKVFTALVPVNLTLNKSCIIKNNSGNNNEQYYKWQLIYSLINSGMYNKDYIGTEVSFPKGNVQSNPIIFDVAIFDSSSWFDHYTAWQTNKNQEELDWLRQHLLIIIEIKKEGSKNIEAVFNQQLKPEMKEAERQYCLGAIAETIQRKCEVNVVVM